MSRASSILERHDAQLHDAQLNERVKYTIATPKNLTRASAWGGSDKKTTRAWVPDPKQFGIHDSNIDAKRAVVLIYHPDLKGSSDEHIKRVSKEYFTGSMAHYKVVKA